MEFEGDETKRTLNLAKHGIDFADAEIIFSNPIIKRRDSRQDYG